MEVSGWDTVHHGRNTFATGMQLNAVLIQAPHEHESPNRGRQSGLSVINADLGDVDGQEGGHGGGEQLVQRRVHDELVAQLEQECRVALADAAHLRSGSGPWAQVSPTLAHGWTVLHTHKPMYTAHLSPAHLHRDTGCGSVASARARCAAQSARPPSVQSVTVGKDVCRAARIC